MWSSSKEGIYNVKIIFLLKRNILIFAKIGRLFARSSGAKIYMELKGNVMMYVPS